SRMSSSSTTILTPLSASSRRNEQLPVPLPQAAQHAARAWRAAARPWRRGRASRREKRLRLIIQGDDINRYSKQVAPVYFRHEASVNQGRHTIHLGGPYDSHLLVPVIPG